MSDSNRDGSSTVNAAQPFLYAPPSGEKSRNAAGTPRSFGFDGQPSSAEYPTSDQAVQKAYEKGLAEGKAGARAEFEKATEEMRSQISGALLHFTKDRTDYFGKVEGEVVRLALSVARKILHRESQIDPLVLTGVVHVALQKLNSDTRVRLRAHPEEARFWGDYFKQSSEIFPTVEVVGDPSLAQGHCTLETDFGSTQISLDTQLKEIEQGFFDLLEQRPKGAE
jgi:flagellar assembly protein FliH